MRLDLFLYKNKYFQSRNKATESILRGEVYLNGVKILKPSFSVDSDSFNKVEILSEKSFVSIGGYKLDKALRDFNRNKILYNQKSISQQKYQDSLTDYVNAQSSYSSAVAQQKQLEKQMRARRRK